MIFVLKLAKFPEQKFGISMKTFHYVQIFLIHCTSSSQGRHQGVVDKVWWTCYWNSLSKWVRVKLKSLSFCRIDTWRVHQTWAWSANFSGLDFDFECLCELQWFLVGAGWLWFAQTRCLHMLTLQTWLQILLQRSGSCRHPEERELPNLLGRY